MRVKHTLWRVGNGYLLTPEDQNGSNINITDASQCFIFKTLDEFAKYTPKRVRKSRKPKTTNKEVTSNAN